MKKNRLELIDEICENLLKNKNEDKVTIKGKITNIIIEKNNNLKPDNQ